MPAISFNSVLIIGGIAVLVPVILGLLPRLPVPGAVLEVIAGIIVGPSVLGWVRVDAPVQVLSDLGLGMLLFLAGLEIDIDRLRGPLARLADTSAQLRVRAALTLALGCGVLAYRFGFASILGAFAAGLLVRLIEISGREPHPQFQIELEGIGFAAGRGPALRGPVPGRGPAAAVPRCRIGSPA
jgi:Kef-type K+ transport system membrane component KefB